MSTNIYIVVIEDDEYGTEIQNVYTDLNVAIEQVADEVLTLAEDHNFDLDDPENQEFIHWGADYSCCSIDQVGQVWIAHRVIDGCFSWDTKL